MASCMGPLDGKVCRSASGHRGRKHTQSHACRTLSTLAVLFRACHFMRALPLPQPGFRSTKFGNCVPVSKGCTDAHSEAVKIGESHEHTRLQSVACGSSPLANDFDSECQKPPHAS